MLCKGDDKEFCGAAGMLNVYTYVAGSKKKRKVRRERAVSRSRMSMDGVVVWE
jgi:hypothetical protein